MRTPHAHISLITRFAEPGRSKTRLIPALGESGAADLQHRMAQHVALQLRILSATDRTSVSALVSGGSPRAARELLGIPTAEQGAGDLGARLVRALRSGLDRADVAAVVGGDCPTLDAADMRRALSAARDHGCAIVPARDGGFCLLALARRHVSALDALIGVEWGTASVCTQVRAGLAARGVQPAMLDERTDVDRPEDLEAFERVRSAWQDPPRRLAVIVPALDESASLPSLLEVVTPEADELVVVDGGSTDSTLDVARSFGARVMTASRSRALQMNAGAAATDSDAVLFLHADSTPRPGFKQEVLGALGEPTVLLGAFEFSLGASSAALRLVERGTNLRARALQLPYGDQGLFMRSAAFRAFGGFPDEAVLEDLLLVEAVRRAGRVSIVPMPLVTSDRRWREMGVWRWSALNLATLAAHRMGARPETLAAWRAARMAAYSNR